MDNTVNRKSGREQLILAGIADIETYGIANFSLRRAAKASGFSCAAPYKHFRNKLDFLVAIMEYISQKWYAIQNRILETEPPDSLHTLYDLAVAYTRFLVDNPHFRSIITVSTVDMDDSYRAARANLSAETKRLIDVCCEKLGLSRPLVRLKTFAVRAMIYGAAMMMDNGQMPIGEESYALLKDAIAAEFRTLNDSSPD